MSSLFELNKDETLIMEMIELSEGVVTEEQEASLAAIASKMVAKVDGCVEILAKWKALEDYYKEVGTLRLNKSTSYKNKQVRLKKYMKDTLLLNDKGKLEGEDHTISLSKTVGTVDVHNQALLPEKYLKTTVSVDKKMVLADLKQGLEVPGCRIIEGYSMRTKLRK